MLIEIHNRENAEDEALSRALLLTMRQQDFERCDIYVHQRDSRGWLEYGVQFKYQSGGGIYIAVIQRRPGEPFETHS